MAIVLRAQRCGMCGIELPCLDAVDCVTGTQKESALLRVLVLGAGVIGSVYAGKLLQAGHEVVVLARGHRLSDLQAHGLVLQDAESGDRTCCRCPW